MGEKSSKLNPNKKREITKSELGIFEIHKKESRIPEEFRDQPIITVKEIGKAAKALQENIAFKFFYETNEETSELKIKLLVSALDKFFEKFTSYYESRNIHLPLMSVEFRNILKELFTKKTKFNSESVYQILGMMDVYGLFHMFCTQMVPVGLNFDFGKTKKANVFEKSDKNNQSYKFEKIERLLRRIFPNRIVVNIDKSKFKKEQEWVSNDKETRIKLANEMFLFLLDYLEKNPNETVTIIEPGAGNGEFTSILAELIFKNTNTRGRVNLILKEFSKKMISEGRHKFNRLKEKLETEHSLNTVDLGIHYIQGSAEIPLQEQIDEIQKLLKDKNLEKLLEEFNLNKQQAEELLNKVSNTKVVAGTSTYTFGAMGKYAKKIAQQTINDVIKGGKIIFVDFAEKPPNKYVQNESNTKNEKTRLQQLKKIYDLYASIGFAQGLAINLGFWEHDINQVWEVYDNIISDENLVRETSSQVDLKPFAFIPIRLRKNGKTLRTIVLPGYFEKIIRTTGLSKKDTTIKV